MKRYNGFESTLFKGAIVVRPILDFCYRMKYEGPIFSPRPRVFFLLTSNNYIFGVFGFQLQCCGINGTSDWTTVPPASCPSDPQVEVIFWTTFCLFACLIKLLIILENPVIQDLVLPTRNKEPRTK